MSADNQRHIDIPEKLLDHASIAFAGLPAEQRRHLSLVIEDHLTSNEISERVGIDSADVLSSLRGSLTTLFNAVDRAASSQSQAREPEESS